MLSAFSIEAFRLKKPFPMFTRKTISENVSGIPSRDKKWTHELCSYIVGGFN